MNKFRIEICLFVLFGLIVVTVFFRHYSNKNDTSHTLASSNTTILNTKPEWDLGSLSNIDTTGDTIKINDKTVVLGAQIDLSGATVTASPDTNKNLVIDGDDCNTYWTNDPANPSYWQIDLGSSRTFTPDFGKSQATHSMCETSIPDYKKEEFSLDGSSWSSLTGVGISPAISCPGSGPDHCTGQRDEPVTARYLRISMSGACPAAAPWKIYTTKLFESGATATHTSAATQITDTNLYQWQTFTAHYNAPANSTVSFRFRTSTDSSTWTAWTASQTPASGTPLTISSLVTSSTGPPGGETFYKYIQVETTLTSTDGIANPTVSDYTIAFHTNVAPNKPTAQNATIGS